MKSTKNLSMKQSALFMIAGLLVFILYLYFSVSFEDIIRVFQQLNPFEYALYYSLAVVAVILSLLFYSMVWRSLMNLLSIDIGMKKSFLYCWIANFVDLILPLETVSGEVTRTYLVNQDIKNNLGKIAASLVGHRIISTLTTLSGLIVTSLYLVSSFEVDPIILVSLVLVIGGTSATVAALFYLSVKEEAIEKLVNILIKLVGLFLKNDQRLANIKDRSKKGLAVFVQGTRKFSENPRSLLKPLLYSYISWFFSLFVYLLVFYALGYTQIHRYVFQVVVVYSIILSVQTIPIGLPVGPVEILMVKLFELLHIPLETGGVATPLIRVITFWFQILVGYGIIQWMGFKHILNRDILKNEGLSTDE